MIGLGRKLEGMRDIGLTVYFSAESVIVDFGSRRILKVNQLGLGDGCPEKVNDLMVKSSIV